ncbi:MAG: YlbF family regulator [Clostridiales bacterium]|nr:YlbF family regulator [Clostridiales bacterium]
MVEQTARQLAEEILKSEYGQALIEAKKAYDEDPAAKQLLTEYVEKQEAFQNKLAMGTITDEEKDAYYDEMNKLNNDIKIYGTSGALYKAENEFNEYTQSIINIITAALQNAIAPENADSCTGSCGSCAGCH